MYKISQLLLKLKNKMNKSDSKKIAETITNEQLGQMFENAKVGITDWAKVSNVNKSITKGVAWNILASDFNVNTSYHTMAKVNMIREFGEFLPENLKPIKKPKKNLVNLVHQEPKFKK